MKGWLDNFGKADNANESNVSLPEDFNGLAYDTTGRNYSPAWGGQFQQGGTLPGSAGFMYARTIDPAPSNGKYAKKTKASAQNGKEMQFYQEGLDWKPKSMQNGGDQISYNDPRYPELYKNRQLGRWLDENNFDSQVPLDEIVVTGQRPSLYKDLRDLTKTVEETAAEFTGIPGTIRFSQDPMENIKGLIRTGDQTGLGLVGLLPGVEQTGFNYNAQDVEGAFNTLDAFGLASGVAGLARRPIQKGLQQVGQNLKNVRMSVPSEIAEGLQTNGIFDIFKAKPKFQSEIDWSKWNPDTPNYPELINEYNAIEESTKKAGTWMKNPDGSAFQGTPEQFIQQQSSYFKKAFPNPVKNELNNSLFNYHGTPNKIDFFDESKFYSGTFGKGIYTSPDKEGILKSYANPKKKRVGRIAEITGSDSKEAYLHELYINSNNPKIFDDIYDVPYDIKNYGKKLEDFPTRKELKEKYKDFLKENEWAGKNDEAFDRFLENANIIPREKANLVLPDNDFIRINDTRLREQVIPFTNYPKSAIGNVGFFDMSNPNIYKGVIPAGIATGLSLDQKRDGGIVKDNQGYLNPDNWGKMVEIDQSRTDSFIDMTDVYEPLLAVSNKGEERIMYPGEKHKFKGSKVTEIPMAKLGINQLDAQPMKKLNQLLNFTNNPDKTNWLDKYQ